MNWNEIKVGEKYNDHHDEVVEVLYKNQKYNIVIIVDQDEKFALYDERGYIQWAEIIEEDNAEEKKKLLDDSITALKNYLNAGCKEQRRASSVIAKKVIEKYNNLKK